MAQEYKRTLYPPIEPYMHDMLKVSDIHSIYYEQSGNPEGNPVLVLHGGPGGGFMRFLL
jgi:proline iminopeptidase